MIDMKNMEVHTPTPMQPPPPAYPEAQTSRSVTFQPQPHILSEAQIGEQYRAELFAQCARGDHEKTTKYGVCGIITAVILFPIGLICLFMDTDEVCMRCGKKL